MAELPGLPREKVLGAVIRLMDLTSQSIEGHAPVPAGSGTRLVVSRIRSSEYVLDMGNSDMPGRGSRREYETRGQLRDSPGQLAELELCLRRCARSGW